MKIKVAESAGFCYGVSRAVDICRQAADDYDNCVTLGPIIHNRFVIDELSKLGVRAVSNIDEVAALIKDTEDLTVIIRSHGAGKHEIDALTALGVNIIDATCPDVKKIHDIVREESETGRFILIIGRREHPEISAICSWCKRYEVFESITEFEKWVSRTVGAESGTREAITEASIAVVFQTTSDRSIYDEFATIIKKECTNAKVYDTVCNATFRRQLEAKQLSQEAGSVIVIGDENSSNSQKLAEICKKHCRRVAFVQSAGDVTPDMLEGSSLTGVTAGASTPAFIIKEVIAKMSMEEIMDGITENNETATDAAASETLPVPETDTTEKTENTTTDEISEKPEPGSASADPAADIGGDADDGDDQESFEDLLEKSIKTLRTGDKVTGVVTSITATEISLDLGTKQSAYIPTSEFIDDENPDINETVKVGDTIESFVMRVNDVEGMIMLSKKRLDALKNWDVIVSARESREIVQGYVMQENKGGIVVNVKGVHVFVPASQTGLSKGEPMSGLLKKNVKLRINEINQARKRVIGSIRDAQKDERREKSEKLWGEIEVGKKYDGVVKSMTSYGVFVDIGGVDGMIHISELSWTRIKQPSEVMSVGDEVSVYVISFDKESRKISLGYKKGEDNPWTKFMSEYSVDDVVTVEIVKMMPFGAFAEICPGVDGLIHISQISDHRIGLPSEVLSEGQKVDVKITEIDNERKKVSLSIRALLEPPADSASADGTSPDDDDGSPQVVYDTDTPPPSEETPGSEAEASEAETEQE